MWMRNVNGRMREWEVETTQKIEGKEKGREWTREIGNGKNGVKGKEWFEPAAKWLGWENVKKRDERVKRGEKKRQWEISWER